MATLKIKKGDMVKVITGKDKDKEGKVIAVNREKKTLLVEGVNMITKHVKPNMANQQGGIVHQEGPIHISNVMYLHNGKPSAGHERRLPWLGRDDFAHTYFGAPAGH